MKLRGRKSAGERFKDVIVFTRGKEAPIAFWVLALDEEWDFFNDSCPRPKPQKLTTAGAFSRQPPGPGKLKSLRPQREK
jgi:hypothetical protein